MADNQNSLENKGILENLEKLFLEAELGNYAAKQRVAAIKKLANPVYDFSFLDYQRILDKKLHLPVKRGLKLFKLMKELTYLVKPIGEKIGSSCPVELIDYQNITREDLLKLKGGFNAGFINRVMNELLLSEFNGLNLLDERQRDLYREISVYFGKRKRPTLQSLAISILNSESDGKEYSERSLYSYLEAVKDYQEKTNKASGFYIFNFTYHSVTEFNKGRTIGEAITESKKSLAEISENLQKTIFPNLMADYIKNYNEKISLNFSQHFKPLFTNIDIFKNAILQTRRNSIINWMPKLAESFQEPLNGITQQFLSGIPENYLNEADQEESNENKQQLNEPEE